MQQGARVWIVLFVLTVAGLMGGSFYLGSRVRGKPSQSNNPQPEQGVSPFLEEVDEILPTQEAPKPTVKPTTNKVFFQRKGNIFSYELETEKTKQLTVGEQKRGRSCKCGG